MYTKYELSIPNDVIIKYEGIPAAAAINIIEVVTRLIKPLRPGNLCFDKGYEVIVNNQTKQNM
jgi:hypothetical protein